MSGIEIILVAFMLLLPAFIGGAYYYIRFRKYKRE